MRPWITARVGKIVGVGHGAMRRRLGMGDLIGNAVALAVSDRLFGGIEGEPHLLAHVTRGGPAHERLDFARRLGLVVEHPFLCARIARLHRGPGGFVDACRHRSLRTYPKGCPKVAQGCSAWSGQQDLNLRPGVPKTPALPGCAMPRGLRKDPSGPSNTRFTYRQQPDARMKKDQWPVRQFS